MTELPRVDLRHGSTARYLSPTTDPLSYVAGYTLCDDVSERAYQLERGGQRDKGKNCETFTPLGPWLVTPDELPGPQDIELRMTANGELRQKASTADMIFPVAETIRFVVAFALVALSNDRVAGRIQTGFGAGGRLSEPGEPLR
ncbi:fumarylacetoacetate hydrolase family protein [Streptomyces sp. CCNWLW230]|uniref:fumarylacetoacetate hydrolase family protein n=1 Tax=unclassified Streptomyces TaxID=2593676 RepID=UPI003FD2940E